MEAPAAPTSDPLEAVRLGAAWIRANNRLVLCLACGGLRAPEAPPCRCRLEGRS